jgi:hypothetical protein
MKRCPACQRTYTDDTLSYCLEDGSALVADRSGSSDLAATLIIPEPRMTAPAKPDTNRRGPTPPQPYTAPPPAWPHVGVAPMPPATLARQGKGIAIASLICAIAAFVLLGFCIIAGQTGVEASLIGGIFLFSVLLALVGAVMGIVATSKSSKDVSAQNSKVMAIVALVLNGFYLLITVVFLILGAIYSSQ